MPIKTIKSIFITPEENNRKSIKVNYESEDKQQTLDEIEKILYYYDFSNIQKQKIINIFSLKMGGELVYKDISQEIETHDVAIKIFEDFISTITKDIFHDLDNKYINRNDQEVIKNKIGEILGLSDKSDDSGTGNKIRSKVDFRTYHGEVYCDETLDTFQTYGSSYLALDNNTKIPNIISSDKISTKKIINIKYNNEEGETHTRTYVKGRKNIIKIFKKQGIRINVAKTKEEATLYLKELFAPWKELYPERWKEPNRFDNVKNYKQIGKLVSQLGLSFIENIGTIDYYGNHKSNWGGVILPIRFDKDKDEFVIMMKDSFQDFNIEIQHYLISNFS